MDLILKTPIRFECQTDCSACCRLSGGYVYLTPEEAEKIAAYLQSSTDEFLKAFTRGIDGKIALHDGENESCVFLEDGFCLIYPVRPRQCRTFPFWPENLRDSHSWEATKQICPGIGKGRWYSLKEIRQILIGQGTTDEQNG